MTARNTFVDTNILVYAFDRSDSRKHDVARELLGGAGAGDLILSTQVLCEFYVVVTRKLAEPLSEQDAAAALAHLVKLPTVNTDSQLVLSGVDISRRARISLWDGLIVAAARVGGCSRILTEDLAHGSTLESVLVENPFSPD